MECCHCATRPKLLSIFFTLLLLRRLLPHFALPAEHPGQDNINDNMNPIRKGRRQHVSVKLDKKSLKFNGKNEEKDLRG